MTLKSFKRIVLDIETNGLLHQLIDFSKMPLKLKSEAKVWLIVLTNKDNPSEKIKLKLDECTRDNLKECFKNTEEVIFHNGVSFDAIFLKLYGILEYKIFYHLDEKGNNGTLFNRPMKITDTLVLSRILNPDRYFGHSLDSWGRYLGEYKTDYRQVCIDAGHISADSPKGHEFREYYPELDSYCEQDTVVTSKILDELITERGRLAIDAAYHMELKICDITLRQEYYGFGFNSDLAKHSVKDLTEKLKAISDSVNPILPPKRLNKGEQKEFNPPSRQFKGNGDISAFLEKFIIKIGATLSEDKASIVFEGNKYDLPLDPNHCLKSEIPSSIDDLDNLKEYLLSLGWIPLEWKERDLLKDSKKKKLSPEKAEAAIHRYVKSTLEGDYKAERLKLLDVKEDKLLSTLLSKQNEFALRVPVSPSIRVGTEKNLCPKLEALGESADFVKDVVLYLTYKHRKNSISGGVTDEDGSPTTGFLALVREDGRISTPANTLGASTGRYLHIGVANIPRVGSIYGPPMRGMFTPGPGRIQFGYDYSSLEACVNGHFVIPYKDGKALADSLVAKKPNDCFDEYTQILTKAGWINHTEINESTQIANWSVKDKSITFTAPDEIIRRNHAGRMITVKTDRLDIRVTPNHRVVLYNRDTLSYVTVIASELSEFLIKNTNCYIPSNGDSEFSIDSVQTNETINVRVKASGNVIQSKDLKYITNVATRQRLSGSSSFIVTKSFNNENIYQTTIGKSPLNVDGFRILAEDVSEDLNVDETVWCVSVPSTYVIVKRNNSMYVSGNCHSINARRLGIDRDAAKSFGYAVMYGAQANKLAKMLQVSDAEAKRLYSLYWDGVPALSQLKEKVEQFWEQTNRQYILAIDKRKLLVRSKHSLINLLFQSTGALLMKYGTIEICKSLEDQGMLGDPFEDTSDSYKVFQMIVYHDECQYSCHPDMFKIHKLKDEDEAKALAKRVSRSGAASHVGDEYWVAEDNFLSKVIEDSIAKIVKDFNFRVNLGVEWQVGDSWASCH